MATAYAAPFETYIGNNVSYEKGGGAKLVIPEAAEPLSGTAGKAEGGVLGGPGSALRFGRDDG